MIETRFGRLDIGDLPLVIHQYPSGRAGNYDSGCGGGGGSKFPPPPVWTAEAAEAHRQQQCAAQRLSSPKRYGEGGELLCGKVGCACCGRGGRMGDEDGCAWGH